MCGVVECADLYSLGKIFSQSLHSCTGSSLSSRSCLKSSLSESKIELLLLQEYFWCRRNSSFAVKSSSQCSQRYMCSSVGTASHSCSTIIIAWSFSIMKGSVSRIRHQIVFGHLFKKCLNGIKLDDKISSVIYKENTLFHPDI